MKKGFWLNLFLVCVGVVTGTLAASMCKNIPFLSWLAYGMKFGMATPATIDLQVISVTFGVTLNLSIAVILFIALAVVLGNLIARK